MKERNKEYYLKKVPTWLIEDTKTIKFFNVILDAFEDIKSVNDAIKLSLNLNEANGKQLDLLGKILGVSRYFDIPNVPNYDGILDDVHYRRLLQGRIVASRWDGSRIGLEKALRTSFGDLQFTIEDHQDLTYGVYVNGVENVSEDPNIYIPNPIDEALIESGKYCPKPMGIKVIYEVVERPVFAYNVNNTALVAGWYYGYWKNEEETADVKQE